jgi:putative nucleic acid modification protein with dual OB domain
MAVQRRELVCLANSIKLGEFCFAGVDVATSEWIRLIGSGQHGAVTRVEQKLEDGRIASLLDIVSVPLAYPEPVPGQPENWILGDGAWEYAGKLAGDEAADLLASLVCEGPIFGVPGKRVPIAAVEDGLITSSLTIACPWAVSWRWEGAEKLYAEFEHSGRNQSLKVTDPKFIAEFADDEPDQYDFDDEEERTTYLTVSLPDEWRGAHWKLVAGVIRI